MIRAGLIGSGALAAGLLAVIAAELRTAPGTPSGIAAGAPGAANRPATAPPSAAAAADHADRWVLTSLQRPLFSPRRRPPAAAPSGPAAANAPGLPRLAGTLISAGGRQAIFAGEGGARPLVVGEGGQVGAWTVQSIAAGAVAVSGPDGTRTVRPTFDRNAPAAPTAAAPTAAAPTAAAPTTAAAATGGVTAPASAGLLPPPRRRPPLPQPPRPVQ